MQQTLSPSTVAADAVAHDSLYGAERAASRPRRRWRALIWALRALALVGAAVFVQAASLAWQPALRAEMVGASHGVIYNFLGWMANALGDKAVETLWRPAAHLDEAEGSAFVLAFMERARTIGALEREAEALVAHDAPHAELQRVSDELAGLRAVHEAERPIAEAVLQRQVTAALAEFGFGSMGQPMPPVLFRFSESPAELVVSPRDRIAGAARVALLPGLPVEQQEQIEAEVEASAGGDVRAIIVPTGGVGAFPTLVVNYGRLEWEASTVAHEWAHTYLAIFPLGITYGAHPDTTLINETVADIVGDEVGLRVLERFYPSLLPAPADSESATVAAPAQPPAFNYSAEMRHTRETLDKFLGRGMVEEAERYLELRRLYFVENGYNIRKLNQAWFAFHGSYGAGAAASAAPVVTAQGEVIQPLGPMVVQLRESQPDLATFLRLARGLKSRADVEQALAEAGE